MAAPRHVSHITTCENLSAPRRHNAPRDDAPQLTPFENPPTPNFAQRKTRPARKYHSSRRRVVLFELSRGMAQTRRGLLCLPALVFAFLNRWKTAASSPPPSPSLP